MGRKRTHAATGKKKAGLLIGMRSGVKSAAKAVSGTGDAAAAPAAKSRAAAIFWNIVTGILALLAGAMVLRRCGVIKF